MVITDRLGKDVVLQAMTTMEAEACAERFLHCWYGTHGFPRAMTSDRGSNWVGDFWRRLCELVGMEQRLSTSFHPETDGATERANQEVLTFLRAFVAMEQLNWPGLLPVGQLAINNRDTSTIGLSPFFLKHGFQIDPIQEVDHFEPSQESPRGRAEAFVERLRLSTNWAQAAIITA
jgi:hypothetical protein